MSLSSPKNVRPFLYTIVACLTCAPVLEGLDDVGGLDGRALKRTPAPCVSTADLLLIMARQNAKRA